MPDTEVAVAESTEDPFCRASITNQHLTMSTDLPTKKGYVTGVVDPFDVTGASYELDHVERIIRKVVHSFLHGSGCTLPTPGTSGKSL